LGGGAPLGLTPYGARTHQLAVASYSAGDPEKKKFYLRRISIHLGDIWGFEICHFRVLCLLLLETLSSYFGSFECSQQTLGSYKDAENFLKF